MFSLVILLLVIGTILAAAEVFMPGFGFFGISGILCIIVSVVLTAVYIPLGVPIVAAELFVLATGAWALIKWAKSRQLYGNLILRDSLDTERKQIGNLEALIGKEGVTAVPMRPFGSVSFNGVKTEAYSEGSFIPKGRTVVVVGTENDRIVVKEVN